MASNTHKSLVTQIQANEKVLIANRRAMDKVQLHLQCGCTHRDANGGLALNPPGHGAPRSRFTNAPLYRCRICKKNLDISNISEEEFEKSLDTIDRVFDLSKMALDLRTEKDQKTLVSFSKQQYKMLITLPDAFKTIRKGGKKKNRNNNDPMSGMIEVGR